MSLQSAAETTVVGVVALALLVTAWRARYRPTTPCWPCKGEGTRRRGIIRRRMVLCRACGGHKIRIRFSRRMANRVILARRHARNVAGRVPS